MVASNTTLIVTVVVLGLALYYYTSSKSTSYMTNPAAPVGCANPSGAEPVGMFAARAEGIQTSGGKYTETNSAALLPKDVNSGWSADPAGNGALSSVKLFNAGTLIGINTVGSTLKNANLQLRSEPPIPKSSVGPWNNSTIEGDPFRVCLELGCTKN